MAFSQATMYINSFVSTILVVIVLYYSHRMLQLQFYRYCKLDLFRLLLFNQSPMCIHANNILNFVETAGGHVIKHVMNQMLSHGLSIDSIMQTGRYQGALTIGIRTAIDTLYRIVFSRSQE